jgi:hypothetical protein
MTRDRTGRCNAYGVQLTFTFVNAHGSTIEVVDYRPSAPKGKLGMTSGGAD